MVPNNIRDGPAGPSLLVPTHRPTQEVKASCPRGSAPSSEQIQHIQIQSPGAGASKGTCLGALQYTPQSPAASRPHLTKEELRLAEACLVGAITWLGDSGPCIISSSFSGASVNFKTILRKGKGQRRQKGFQRFPYSQPQEVCLQV